MLSTRIVMSIKSCAIFSTEIRAKADKRANLKARAPTDIVAKMADPSPSSTSLIGCRRRHQAGEAARAPRGIFARLGGAGPLA